MKKIDEYKKPLYTMKMQHKKAFDYVQITAVLEAIRKSRGSLM